MRSRTLRALAGLFLACGAVSIACAQSDRPYGEDMPLEDYLAAMAQVSPAAREGAEAFLSAFHARCGRAMSTLELRRAVAEGTGDPVLMAMIRAAYERDAASTQRLAASVSCKRG